MKSNTFILKYHGNVKFQGGFEAPNLLGISRVATAMRDNK